MTGIDIDRLRVILWRICELGWGRGRGANNKGGVWYKTSLREVGGQWNKKGWPMHMAGVWRYVLQPPPPPTSLKLVWYLPPPLLLGPLPSPPPPIHNCSCCTYPTSTSDFLRQMGLMDNQHGIASLVFWALKSFFVGNFCRKNYQ